MNSKDPKGYYEILELSHTASAAEIKAAYRRRAMELHPDRNKSQNTTKEFQYLNEAYSILSEPPVRAQYDTITVETTHHRANTSKTAPEPIVCSVCGKVTAQPRYAIFYEVKSFILVTTRAPIQGIFCSACAEKKSLRATAITWLLGWWGFPWGPIYSLHAIFVNLLGGQRPHNINARLAVHQAWVFAALGKLDIARAIALDALDLARKIKPEQVSARLRKALGYDVDAEGAHLRKEIGEFLSELGASDSVVHLRDSWSLFRRPFYVQGLIGLTVTGLVWGAILNDKPSSPPLGPKPYIANPQPTIVDPFANTVGEDGSKPSITNPEPTPPPTPVYVRPTTAPNGQFWPTAAGYVQGYGKLHTNGLSAVTVDNSQNDSDVFVKLVSLNGSQAYPVRTFYIPGHGSFTLSKVTAGSYDIRYRDLGSGSLSRSESFRLEETPKDNGTEFSNMTMTLYKVRNGNMQTYNLAEGEF